MTTITAIWTINLQKLIEGGNVFDGIWRFRMVSERACLDVLKFIQNNVEYLEYALARSDGFVDHLQPIPLESSSVPLKIFSHLSSSCSYSAGEITDAIEWLEQIGLIYQITRPQGGSHVYRLADGGLAAAKAGEFAPNLKRHFGVDNPYAVFVAHQFRADEKELVSYFQKEVLNPNGFYLYHGHVRNLDDFRHDILNKIREARFFVCLLAPRNELKNGQFVSSVWLHQETGAAIMAGKKPLVLVDQRIAEEYRGGMSGAFQHDTFDLNDYKNVFISAMSRIREDLEKSGAVLPKPVSQEFKWIP